jgi:SAM-dependent methyltransferase
VSFDYPNRSEDTKGLEARAAANQGGDFDLGGWIATELALGPEDRVLDLGAGTGVQLLRYARTVDPPGFCAALDVSEPSLALLRERASEAGLEVHTFHLDMDDLTRPDVAPELYGLTRAVAAWALYYSRDARALIEAIAARLSPTGVLVVAGPAKGNNAGWYELLSEAGVAIPRAVLDVSESFHDDVVLPAGRRAFRAVRCANAQNHVRFSTPAELLRYWRSNIYFDAAFDARVAAVIDARFAREGTFEIVKLFTLVHMEGPVR